MSRISLKSVVSRDDTLIEAGRAWQTSEFVSGMATYSYYGACL